MFALQKATTEARARLGDKTIGTQVKDGKVQVIRVTYDAKGKGSVSPVTDWLAADAAVSYLNGMQ